MAADPTPLPEGTLLAERFELDRMLGRGAFGIVYLARDRVRNDLVVVKELAPTGLPRSAGGQIELPPTQAHRMRQNFLAEAKTISRLHIRGVLPVRMAFSENGTAYFATDYLATAQTLESILEASGRLNIDFAMDVIYQCLEILEAIHEKGILHRDMKPSNVLVNARGEVTLIDFGAAREWQADLATTHTVLFTPHYAPLEQMTEHARRGPATDLFALSAMAYEMLTGRKPQSATDRASGMDLTPVMSLRSDLDVAIAMAIEAGLELKVSDRPQSAEIYRELLAMDPAQERHNGLAELDAIAVQLLEFRFERRQCPACQGLLIDPKPLRRHVCPVCQQGSIRTRKIIPHRCPICRIMPMKRIHNQDPMSTCPTCRTGWLQVKYKGFRHRILTARCADCGAEFNGDIHAVGDQSWVDLRQTSGRSEFMWHCTECGGQLDESPDGRLEVRVAKEPLPYRKLYPEEWDLVAAGLEPGSGNAECDHCGADYFVEGENVTLLGATEDPHRFAKNYSGRLLTFDEVRWLAVDKTSPRPGLTCQNCSTEFDRDGDYWRLVHTADRELSLHLDEPFVLPDWHRIARGLPTVADEAAFHESVLNQIRIEYRTGTIGFDSSNETTWKGPATNLESGQKATLTVGPNEIYFGGILRKFRLPIDAVTYAKASGREIILGVSAEPDPIRLEVESVDFTEHLESGKYTVELGAEDLAARISLMLEQVPVAERNGG